MQTTTNNIKLGIFITLGLGIFIIGIYYIGKKQQLFNRTFGVSGIFRDVSGLQIGNNVRFLGINVGIVQDIKLISDSTVQVFLQIDESTKLYMKKNAKALVGSDGLMGNKIMLIVPSDPSNQVIANNDVIATAQPINLDDILLQVKVTTNNTASITSDLAAIIKNIRDGRGTIGKLTMDNRFADNVDQSLVNIKQGSKGLKDNMDAASHSFFLKRYFRKKNKAKDK
jgi:phospholipid/cholesterol/gamma-HCH transport system substrate-binding protein